MTFTLRPLAVALSLLLSTACATGSGISRSGFGPSEKTTTVAVRVVDGNPDRAEDAPDAQPEDIVCSKRHAVGTNFPRIVCTSRAEREAQRRDAQDAIAQSITRETRRRALEKQ